MASAVNNLLRTCFLPCFIPFLHASLERLATLGQRLRRLTASSRRRLARSVRWLWTALLRTCRLLAASVDPFWVLLLYFVSNSFMGFLLLWNIEPKVGGTAALRSLDLLFTSVSAATVSSMSTVEIENFSRGQLAVVAILMLVGGEVFTSMLHLHLTKAKLLIEADADASLYNTPEARTNDKDGNYQIELGTMVVSLPPSPDVEAPDDHELAVIKPTHSEWELKYSSVNLLGTVVFWYNAIVVTLGSASILLYLAFVSSGARDVMRKKGIHVVDFSVFLSMSSFANGGFVPVNENMLPFRRNSGLLLLIVPVVLSGNTMFPVCLRMALWVLRKLLRNRRELFDYLLSRSDGRQLGFQHLLSSSRCVHLVFTAAAFLGLQFTLFCFMEWNSGAGASNMSAYEKAVAVLFQSVNSRHAGESVFDLSVVSPAVLVLYVVMMYLPPYTSFSRMGDDKSIAGAKCRGSGGGKKFTRLLPGSFNLSQLSCIAIFVILVCVTERKKLAEDPLNFNLLSVVIEVVSAYGNVGFSTGYNCGRQLKPVGSCENKWYGFVGQWSDGGKLILIAVMFYGRLKEFSKRGGEAWELS